MKDKEKKPSGYWAVSLINVKNNIPCYTKESVDRRLEKMQDTIDFLTGQNTRLKKIAKEHERWKQSVKGYSRWFISKLIEKHEKEEI